jgi:hypothetical protein
VVGVRGWVSPLNSMSSLKSPVIYMMVVGFLATVVLIC